MTGITIFGCAPDEGRLFRELAPRLGVVPTITTAAPAAEHVAGNRCISVSHTTPVTGADLLALSRVGVEYISTRSVGYDHIDVDYAAHVGVTVGNVAYSPGSVADYTLMLMLVAVRDAKAIIRSTDSHDYRPRDERARELRDLTVGVIGTGRIGTAVIDRLRGFGCRVLAHDDHAVATTDHVPLDDLLRRSDIVTLHAPLTAGTHHLLDSRRIAQMKGGSIVVNTARGSLVDTAALLLALESGQLGGAALDVLEGEEQIFSADHRDGPAASDAVTRLQSMANVFISPHIAYRTHRALRDCVENSLINCVNFESGRTAWAD